MKKRFLSCLLICVMLLGLCPVGAAAATEGDPTGELRLALHRSGAVAPTQFAVRLTAQGEQSALEDHIRAAQGESLCALHLSDIPDGRYTLTLTAPGYLPYTQELDFDGRCVQLTLYNYASVNEGRTQADGLFGVFPAGDVNGDGAIDDADAEAIVAAMDTQNAALDLDGSGTVDLADLTIAVRNAGQIQQATAVHTVSSKVLARAVIPQAAVGTATGSPLSELLDLQKEDTRVALAPVADAPISAENPVEVALPTSVEITAPEGSEEAKAQVAAAAVQAEAIYIAAPADSQSTIAAGTVTVEGVDQDGMSVTIEAPIGQSAAAPAAVMDGQATLMSAQLLADASPEVTVEQDGSVIIDLGRRVAIKKVTIRVTKTADQGKLAEIAKVEFLSDFAERIPEPQLSIPKVLSVSNTESDGQGYKNLTVTWPPQTNVTGYEVNVSGPGYNKSASATKTSHTFQGDSFNGTVKSFETYQIKVRSVSGDWRSAWSEPYSHTVTCTKKPPAPQYLSATAAVQSLKVSWNCKFDAEWYTLYYKEASAAEYTAVEKITSSSYTIPNLTGGTRYTMYVVAHNRNGASPKSQNAEGTPLTPTGVEMPKYKLLNVDDAQGGATTHVTSISGQRNKSYTIYKGDGTTVTNSTATAEDWKALLDNDPKSYLLIPDWDSGVAYANFRGPIIQLDKAYTMDTIRMSPFEGSNIHMNAVKITYKDEDGTLRSSSTSFYTRYDSLSRRYYEVVLPQPITTDYLEIRTSGTYGNVSNYTISEVKLYLYDDIEHQVADLFADEMRTTLKPTVTKAQVDALVERVNTPDSVSGELHPHRSVILADLDYALTLLADSSKLAEIITVDNLITASGNPQNGFAQALSDYQPLGYVAGAGDTVVIYVSDTDDKTPRGKEVNLNLIATQYHPQVAAWQKSVIRLKAGRNEVAIPKIGSDATERGGSLYLQYTGARGANHYALRVTGATAIPTLRLDEVTGEERTAAIKNYVNQLQSYVATLEAKHAQLHAGSDNANVNAYAYHAKNCFLNATEITMDNMMYSVPATQVWGAISGSADPAARLESAIAAMEQQIDYFYAFKGLNRAATDKDAYPFTRLNIRYHQMFTGAFMYAGGKHIGIEFGSVGGLFAMSPVVTDANGKYVSGKYAGWGIAHEIGHCINAGAYQRVEVTNNVFAQLAKTGGASETSANFRTSYQNVYKAVATGTTGHTGNLAVQLAMYWQLHLAYDNDYTYKTYDSIADQQSGLFYARLESYLRDRSKASPALPSGSGGDQLFMQAACAAAQRDVLEFFTAWGFHPDATTLAYAANFEKESRKIQYVDDDSRLYRMEGRPGMSADAAVTAAITNATDRRINGSRVTITLGNTNENEGAMLGYEICRNGKVVAFVTADKHSYTDVVTTENNKAFTYTVTGVDRLLNQTETLALGEVKVCHDGAIDKSGWTATTNMTSPKDAAVDKDDDDPESGAVDGNATPVVETVSAITAALDNDPATVYYGAASGSRPTVTLDLGGVEQVTALKFTPAAETYSGDAAADALPGADLYRYRLFGYRVEVSLDGESWQTVKEGNAYTGSAANPNSWVKQSDVIYNADGSYTLYFCKKNDDGTLDPFMYTYDAAYIRLTATNMSALAVAELDVLGPTSDNVELIEAGYGRLSAAYNAGKYADGADCVIPAGAVVFYGAYKGDPSYNVVLLKDQNGKVLDGSQLIFAEVPEKGALGETSDGRWFFWLEDVEKTDGEGDRYNEMDQLAGLTTVRAELYRVQDATALTGQRLTSTSLTMTLPQTLPAITITDASTRGVVHVPDEAAVLMAKMGEEADPAITPEDVPAPEGFYGDTGAAETAEASPVILTGGVEKVSYAARPDALALAAQVDFTVAPAGDKAGLQPDFVDGLYQAQRYDAATGKATLYAVARAGNLGSVTLTGGLSALAAQTEVTATALAQVDCAYVRTETALSATAQAQSASHSGSGSGGSGGGGSSSSGGSSKPSGGGAGGGSAPATATPKTPFADVAAGSWYEDAVQFVHSKGMMLGTSDTHFAPEETTSRAMIVTILWRLEGSPVADGGAGFTDVDAGAWYAGAVAWASAQGIVNGMGDGTFAPDAPITREQFAAILYRYVGYKGYGSEAAGDLTAFSDTDAVSPYALEALNWANGAGLITGMGGGVLAPQGSATRAQAATIFQRFCTGVQK